MGRQQKSFTGTVSKFSLSLGLVLISVIYAMWQNLGGGQSAVARTSLPPETPGESYKAANDALLQTLLQLRKATSSTAVSPAPVAQPAKNAAPPPVSQPAKATISVPVPVPPTPTPAPVPVPQKPAGLYVDGSYTGSSADAYYGTVQVLVVVQNGKMTDVQFLQHPDSRSNSIRINNEAMPLLTQEAIQAQSANVDGVSGATFTSGAFQQSLASALALAKN